MNAITIFISLALFPSGAEEAPQKTVLGELLKPFLSPANPGFALALTRDGKLVFQLADGLADLETRQPWSLATPSYAASLAKPITAEAVLTLIQAGKLRQDDLLSDYLPAFTTMAAGVRIRHLLNHTSGLPDYYGLIQWGGFKGLGNAEVIEMVLSHGRSDFEPGSRFAYSNTGYILLAEIVAQVVDQGFALWMQNSIFKPKGMINTTLIDTPQRLPARRALGYKKVQDVWRFSDYTKTHLNGNLYHVTYTTIGAGGLYTSVDDLLAYGRAVLPHLEGQRQEIQAIPTNQTGLTSDTAYHAGLFRGSLDGQLLFWHKGDFAGFHSLLAMVPNEGLVLAIMSNNRDLDTTALAKILFEETLKGQNQFED